MILPIDASCVIRSCRFHAFAIHISIRMTRAVPAAIEDRKKEMGITGDHHCGASLSGISRNSEPSELWCMVESVTAAMASMMGSAFLPLARNDHARKENSDCSQGRIDQIAREQVDEQRKRKRHVSAGPAPPYVHRPLQSPSLERYRKELEQQDRDIETDTPGNLEHCRLLGSLQAELIEVPGQSEIGNQVTVTNE